jgi:hypothetical protein
MNRGTFGCDKQKNKSMIWEGVASIPGDNILRSNTSKFWWHFGLIQMNTIQRHVQVVWFRQQWQWCWQCTSVGLLIGGLTGCLLAVARILTDGRISALWIILAVTVPMIAGAVTAMLRPRTVLAAARWIDDTCRFKDRIQTALQFAHSPDQSSLNRLQIEDAESHLRNVSIEVIAPIIMPRSWSWGIVSSFVAMLLATVSVSDGPAQAEVVQYEVVVEQAGRAAEEMEQLKEIQKELNDPELEKMLETLKEQLKKLAEPGVDLREALLKLSEMEAAVQEMQQQVSETSTQAMLQETGDALSLADSLAAAGQAMFRGELAKAADELDKAIMPELDRPTEKAVTEKLEQQSCKGGSRTRLKEAIANLSQGLSEGNRSRFQEGVSGLASECRKQVRKKKLSDLLRRQCLCLSECKSQVEGEYRSQADSRKKGGQNAGKGTAGDPAGEKTVRMNAGPEVKLKGSDSGNGDAETETETAPEQEQAAIREYQQKFESYEALSESVLESESIPLGHRQTIRRYFEMIRPTVRETDQVDQKTEQEK